MSKHYRFKDKYHIEEYNKHYVYVDGMQISYPSAEVLLMAEIKPLVVEPEPEYDATTQYTYHYYEDGEKAITQKWQVEPIPEGDVEDANA